MKQKEEEERSAFVTDLSLLHNTSFSLQQFSRSTKYDKTIVLSMWVTLHLFLKLICESSMTEVLLTNRLIQSKCKNINIFWQLHQKEEARKPKIWLTMNGILLRSWRSKEPTQCYQCEWLGRLWPGWFEFFPNCADQQTQSLERERAREIHHCCQPSAACDRMEAEEHLLNEPLIVNHRRCPVIGHMMYDGQLVMSSVSMFSYI